MSKLKDMTGFKKGKLTVTHRANGKWVCDCECGNKHTVSQTNLVHGNINSCGCLKKELLSKEKLTHGLTDSRLYSIWGSMKTRCTNRSRKSFRRYGGRGIEVCKEWIDNFSAFHIWAISNGYKDGLVIDRVNNDAGYNPENCRWVTPRENCRNKSNNVVGTIDGVTKCVTEFCADYCVPRSRVFTRLNKGWDIESALTVPPIPPGETHIKWVELDGDRLSFSNAAKKYGIKRTAVQERIRRGWDIEKAFKTPVGVKR